jgi:hypothetical protein
VLPRACQNAAEQSSVAMAAADGADAKSDTPAATTTTTTSAVTVAVVAEEDPAASEAAVIPPVDAAPQTLQQKTQAYLWHAGVCVFWGMQGIDGGEVAVSVFFCTIAVFRCCCQSFMFV